MDNRIFKFYLKNGLYGFLKETFIRGAISLYGYSFIRSSVKIFFSKRYPDKWVFILGCYNSGTSILEKLLSSHPEIRTLPREGARLSGVLPRPEDLGWTRMWIGCREHMTILEKDEKRIFDNVVHDWSPWWGKGGTVFLEKSISNLTRMEFLSKNFENAYFIGITRNGYAASEGIYRRSVPKKDAQKKFGNSFPIKLAAQQWVDSNELLLSAPSLLDKYNKVRYEDLVNNPEDVILRLFKFIGVSDDLNMHNHEDGVVIGDELIKIFNGNDLSFSRLSNEDVSVVGDEIKEVQSLLGYEVIHQ